MFKAILFTFVISLPLLSHAGQHFGPQELEHAAVGSVVTEGRIVSYSCVKGRVAKVEFKHPKITYRMYSAPSPLESSGKSTFVVEIIIAQSERTISDLKNREAQKIDKEFFPMHCGEKYLAKVTYGSRMAYRFDVDTAEAMTLPTKTITESDESVAKQFLVEATSVVQNIKTFSGMVLEVYPWRPIGSQSPAELVVQMPAYRDAAIRDPSLKGAVEAVGEVYSPELIKRITVN